MAESHLETPNTYHRQVSLGDVAVQQTNIGLMWLLSVKGDVYLNLHDLLLSGRNQQNTLCTDRQSDRPKQRLGRE